MYVLESYKHISMISVKLKTSHKKPSIRSFIIAYLGKKKKILFACPPLLSRKGSVGQVFFSFSFFSSSFSHKISVGQSEKLFTFKKRFRSGEISVGLATKHGQSVEDKQAIFFWGLIYLLYSLFPFLSYR